MVAALLYVVGLVATLVTIALVGLNAPATIQAFDAGLAQNGDVVATSFTVARSLAWAIGPFVGGLVVMGLGRIIMLLGSIDRALRGNP
jgi:hypothetical protein